MRYLLYLLLVLATPASLAGQRTCALRPAMDTTSGTLVYPACATDRPARLLWSETLFRYPEVLRSAGIAPTSEPVIQLVIDSNGVVVPGSVVVTLSPNHPGFRYPLAAFARGWRFAPAIREGRPVASMDSVRVRLRTPPTALIPRGCVDCDIPLEAARGRAMDSLAANARCAEAIATVMAWDIPESRAWAFELAPTCPGASDAAEVAVRLAAYRYSHGIGPARWPTFASQVRSPGAFEFALEAARRGHRFAFTILAFQVSGLSARIGDSIPSGWDHRKRVPTRGCGPIRFFERPDTIPPVGMDSMAIGRALALADSLMTAEGVDASVRASAWCLATQLR